MPRHLLETVVFLLGLLAVCWVGAGYLGSNPLALGVTLLIGIGYVAGARELLRYRQATSTLELGLAQLPTPPLDLDAWLGQLDPSLRQATRQRIEGQRVALPGPTLTPYLVGLLVLLGMLGTLLGMVAMLRGTGLALETATDLQAIRDSLAAPVKGLGFAFGTSIAGVASSAMLGLLSALCRRERLRVTQLLDVKISTELRLHSQAHKREQAFVLLQQQTGLMPVLIDQLQAMMASLEQQQRAAGEHQASQQAAFHARTETLYTQLAGSVRQSLQDSIGASTKIAGAALQPVMENTLAAIAAQATTLHEGIAQAVQQQLQALNSGFAASTSSVADTWQQALATQQQTNHSLTHELRGALDQFNASTEQRTDQLLDGVSSRLDATAGHLATAWTQALAQQQEVNATLTSNNQAALASAASAFEQQATSLLRNVDQSQAQLQSTLAEQDQQRLALWRESLTAMGSALRQDWQQAGAEATRQQQAVCETLARTANDITRGTQQHASDTIAEISRLMHTAAEAPRAAAEVIAELRQTLSDSMVRDTAILEERSQLMATLDTLLAAVNHASTEQRSAIDALVSTSSELLDRVGTQFTHQVQAQASKLDAAANQVSVGAVEVASLGEAFGSAVQVFGQSNDQLAARLQGIETALAQSMARSDEQLAYYVAQAREVIDLSLLTQKQIIEDLQQVSTTRALASAAAA